MDYYEILGVSPEATAQEIKKAFRQIARECHPDVTGDDPAAAERFKVARKAYETLVDPVTRTRYDNRHQRRSDFTNGSFFDAFYRQTGAKADARAARGTQPRHPPKPDPGPSRRGRSNPANDLDLDDLFHNDGDFGFGTSRGATASKPPPSAERVAEPKPGADVSITLEVPAVMAETGGTLTAVYYRLQRVDGDSAAGVARVQDIADIRVVPGTRDGDVFRERGLGDAGANGGSYGDLLARVKIVGRAPEHGKTKPPLPDAPTETGIPRLTPDADGVALLEISVVEAILGGRVEVEAPHGRVKLTVPPGTSSGTTLRLKGKGEREQDLYVRIRIVVPRHLDTESRRLIEEFARLNPDLGRKPVTSR